MTLDMDIEQFDLEGPSPPANAPEAVVRVRPQVWVLGAVLALVAGLFVLGHGASPVPAPLPESAATGPAGPTPGPGQRQYVAVSAICGPVTDRRATLAVSFEVSNVSPSSVNVEAVTGVLPDGGLRQRGLAARGGSCARPGSREPTGTIPAGQSRFFTLTFDLPRSCPARYPVQVQIDFIARGFAESSLSLLYGDLSVPDFDTCGPVGGA
jgi:hypothetical protein